MNEIYERYRTIRDSRNLEDSQIAKETGITKSTFSEWKAGKYTPKPDKLQKIADYFGVPLSYLLTGKAEEEVKSKSPELTAKDERDIAKDLDRIMGEIRKGDDGPLYYNGVEISEASLGLLQNAIEYALRETKKENKEKYNPHKNKK